MYRLSVKGGLKGKGNIVIAPENQFENTLNYITPINIYINGYIQISVLIDMYNA